MGKMSVAERIDCPEYNELISGLEAAKAKVAEAGKDAVAALFKAFFAKYPHVTAVGWHQYTPYFNDGDPCEFLLCEFYATTKSGIDFADVSSIDDEDENVGFADSYSMEDAAVKEAVRCLERSSDDDLFEAAFGDHVQVIATPDGFHVSEYSHD